MSFIFDNLIAILVASVLLGALLLLQQRDQQDAIEAVQRHRAHMMASDLANTLEREIENARGREETERIFSVEVGGPALAADEYRFRVLRATAADGTEYTRHVSFPTLFDPNALSGSALGIVTYAVAETGETLFIDGRERPLLQATRFEFPRGGPLKETTTYGRLLDFDVTAFEPDGAEVLSRVELAETPLRVHIELVYAPEGPTTMPDGAPVLTATSTRHARSVRIPASTAYERFSGTLSGPGGIPALPGDDDWTDEPGVATPPSDTPPSDPPPSDTPPGDTPPETTYTICHNPGPDQVTMTVPASEAPRHGSHGDSRGACAPATPPPTDTPPPAPPPTTPPPTGTPPPTTTPPTPADPDTVLCHKPGDKQKTRTVKNAAQVETHLAHGDYLGPCR